MFLLAFLLQFKHFKSFQVELIYLVESVRWDQLISREPSEASRRFCDSSVLLQTADGNRFPIR